MADVASGVRCGGRYLGIAGSPGTLSVSCQAQVDFLASSHAS